MGSHSPHSNTSHSSPECLVLPSLLSCYSILFSRFCVCVCEKRSSTCERLAYLFEPKVVLALELIGAVDVLLVLAVLHVRSVQDLVVAGPRTTTPPAATAPVTGKQEPRREKKKPERNDMIAFYTPNIYVIYYSMIKIYWLNASSPVHVI